MQLADAAEAIAVDAGPQAYFVYYKWMEEGDIPMDVTHVRIHSSVRAIKSVAFNDRWQLRVVILNEELEEIGEEAFRNCESMEEIVIPDNVRKIKGWAFCGCTGVTRVTLGSGLEEIGVVAFYQCMMEEIVIPPAVREIHDTAFNKCTNLTRIRFCPKIEDFVSCEAMQEWWNQGVHERCLSTYSFLVRCDIPARIVGLALVSSWQATIHDTLRIIPTISNEGRNAHFDAIDAKLTMYENLLNEASVLFPDRLGLDEGIVLTIVSFL